MLGAEPEPDDARDVVAPIAGHCRVVCRVDAECVVCGDLESIEEDRRGRPIFFLGGEWAVAEVLAQLGWRSVPLPEYGKKAKGLLCPRCLASRSASSPASAGKS